MKTNQEYINSIKELVAIRSVCERDSDEYPYGKGVDDALNYVINLCDTFGFNTKNCDGKIGYAEIGTGTELVGILCHIDTVPEGSGWKYDPFVCEIVDGKMFGRGVIDDKGPAIASIYAMKDILDSGIKLNKRFRIIFGTTEETGIWDDIEYYKSTEEIPKYGFTPDGYFPCVSGEKGILHIKLIFHDTTGFDSIMGGTAANVVPDKCNAEITINGVTFILNEVGVPAHGTLPEKGVNAISKLMTSEKVKSSSLPFAKFYNEIIGMNYYGENSCPLSDSTSGNLTMNIGKIEQSEDGISLLIDIRYPVSKTKEEVLEKIESSIRDYDCSLEEITHLLPVFMNQRGKLIKSLLSEYKKVTGDDRKPLVIGGGTYARAMNNIVAFGPMFPNREETEHQANEHIYVEDLFALREIYRNTLISINNQ